MNKRKAKKRQRTGRPDPRARKTKNPLKGPFPPDVLMGVAADLLVSSALRGATFREKGLVAVFIPTLLTIIRSAPEGSEALELIESSFPVPGPKGEKAK